MIIRSKPRKKIKQPKLNLPFEMVNGIKYIKSDVDSENKMYFNEQINKPKRIKFTNKK